VRSRRSSGARTGTSRAAAALTIVAALAFASGCGQQAPAATAGNDAGPAPTPRIPTLAACPTAGTSSALPRVALECLRKGTAVDTTALGGRPVLINLWASWCVPCKHEMPSLQAAYQSLDGRLGFLGIDTTDETNSANDFLAAISVHYAQVVDKNGDLLHRLGGNGLPLTLVLNGAGRTVYSHRGELRPVDLRAALRAAGITAPDAMPTQPPHM
jgi:cytochrome c biogenesis protein CcmG/thiol:disulfide interchange protein DsbE